MSTFTVRSRWSACGITITLQSLLGFCAIAADAPKGSPIPPSPAFTPPPLTAAKADIRTGKPIATMKKFPGRAKTVHVKPANGGDGRLVGDPNDGNLAKWPSLFAACEDPKIGGTEWYILEYDGGSMEQVEGTVARLKEWGKI